MHTPSYEAPSVNSSLRSVSERYLSAATALLFTTWPLAAVCWPLALPLVLTAAALMWAARRLAPLPPTLEGGR